MSPTSYIIIFVFVAGVSILAVGSIGIEINEFQISLAVITLIIAFIMGVVYFFIKDFFKKGAGKNDYIAEALKYTIRWAKEVQGVDLTRLEDGKATTRSFPGDKEVFVGFRLHKAITDSVNPGAPITAVVGTSPLRIRDYQDFPGPELLADPFSFFSAGFSGAPTPNANPERDASFYGQKWQNRGAGNVFNFPSNTGGFDSFLNKKGRDED
jgi:hypothetical protein